VRTDNLEQWENGDVSGVATIQFSVKEEKVQCWKFQEKFLNNDNISSSMSFL
jgi:hypothetical protein